MDFTYSCDQIGSLAGRVPFSYIQTSHTFFEYANPMKARMNIALAFPSVRH